ncbi:hypothetical protein ANN_12476 [Periplaneta americana]|uniref:Mos1 transposase HTH domain-containing protein n=1 Tax=Periplaneta americana TaxID=6978 RepID=A0ABQ8TI33_PERAM|nr:hypothetical protein ANN_12476 [Periplaneta americana]
MNDVIDNPADCEVRSVIRFLNARHLKPAEIYRQLKEVYGDTVMNERNVRKWCEMFNNGRTNVHDETRPGRPSLITEDLKTKVDRILQDRRTSLDELHIAFPNISRSLLGEIVSQHLGYHKICALWVPRQLSDQHKTQRMASALTFLMRYHTDGDAFLDQIVTGDETWVSHNTSETKRQSRQWHYPSSPKKPKKFKQTLSTQKVMATVFWDRKGVLLLDFMPKGTTINANRYCKTLRKLRRPIQKKRRGMLSRGVVLLHDNAHPHTAASTRELLDQFGWEIFDHPPYSPDLAPSDFHLFTKLKDFLGGTRFGSDEELKKTVNTWLNELAAEEYNTGILKLVNRYDKCLNLYSSNLTFRKRLTFVPDDKNHVQVDVGAREQKRVGCQWTREKLFRCRVSNPGPLVNVPTLYQLSYPGTVPDTNPIFPSISTDLKHNFYNNSNNNFSHNSKNVYNNSNNSFCNNSNNNFYNNSENNFSDNSKNVWNNSNINFYNNSNNFSNNSKNFYNNSNNNFYNISNNNFSNSSKNFSNKSKNFYNSNNNFYNISNNNFSNNSKNVCNNSNINFYNNSKNFYNNSNNNFYNISNNNFSNSSKHFHNNSNNNFYNNSNNNFSNKSKNFNNNSNNNFYNNSNNNLSNNSKKFYNNSNNNFYNNSNNNFSNSKNVYNNTNNNFYNISNNKFSNNSKNFYNNSNNNFYNNSNNIFSNSSKNFCNNSNNIFYNNSNNNFSNNSNNFSKNSNNNFHTFNIISDVVFFVIFSL